MTDTPLSELVKQLAERGFVVLTAKEYEKLQDRQRDLIDQLAAADEELSVLEAELDR